MKRSYTKEQLEEAVKSSFSVYQVLGKLGKCKTGSAHYYVKEAIKEWGIDKSHFTGRGHLKGKKNIWSKNKWKTEEILVKNTPYKGGNTLKKRLFKENIFEKKCYKCQRTEWEGVPIPLELEHKNGNRYDNRLENLTILCPNCHALTDTYCGKNKKYIKIAEDESNKNRENLISKSFSKEKSCKPNRYILKGLVFVDIRKLEEDLKIKSAAKVGKEMGISEDIIRTYCKNNNIKIPYKYEIHKKFEVSKEELEKLVAEQPFTQIGKMFGVSDNAVRKRCKKLGVEMPKNRLGYWAKKYAEEKRSIYG